MKSLVAYFDFDLATRDGVIREPGVDRPDLADIGREFGIFSGVLGRRESRGDKASAVSTCFSGDGSVEVGFRPRLLERPGLIKNE